MVTRAAKVAAGVNPQDTKKSVAGANVAPKTKIQVTDSAPVYYVYPEDNLTIKIVYHQSGAGLRTGSKRIRSQMKPVGAQSVQFFYKLIAPVPGRPPYEGMVPMAVLTRSPSTFTFEGTLGGKTAFIACRYCSAKGEMGKWSGIVSITIPIMGAVS